VWNERVEVAVMVRRRRGRAEVAEGMAAAAGQEITSGVEAGGEYLEQWRVGDGGVRARVQCSRGDGDRVDGGAEESRDNGFRVHAG
jgi:hypothetical protein